jgi:deoxyribodipyrimidine photolyase-related protein
MAGFYREQRRRFGILLDDGGGPVGGKWSFDPENRKALPKDIDVPPVRFPEPNEHVAEALRYVDRRFGDNPGQVDSFGWPVTRRQALAFLDDFLAQRLDRFGDYEDAVSSREPFVFHSLLSPAINAGLVTPREVVDRTLAHSGERDTPINSLEGFVRQIVGWREYMRAVYVLEGEAMRSANTFGHERPMPAAFYDGTTGLEPVDCIVRRVIERGWCHHIERLMILGNVMLLCEIDPAAVYRWFMELFVDAYDWVMVPNVYGMSQYADGGSIVTKPYVSSSNYVRKMSDFGRGPWCAVWDGLYWRFIAKHRDRFAGNPRMKTMVRSLDRMKPETLRAHREAAEGFLAGLG